MKKVIIALVVTVLIVLGVVGYMWMYRGTPGTSTAPQNLEGCSGSGLALIRYNGSTVKVRYEMHPDFKWEHGRKVWYCLVQVYFLQPVNGVGGFGVPKEEFESKYLVKYLSNSTEGTPPTLLESLNGEWVSAGGEALTEWWNSLPEVKASQIWGYINQLWDRMENSNKYYDYTFPSSQWSVPPKPLPNQTVKIYSIRLWYGARLDILAYQNPTNPSKLEVVMYGTIENWTKWYDGIARLAVFNGLVPTWAGNESGDLWYAYSTSFGAGLRTSVGYGFAVSLIYSLSYIDGNHAPVKLAVWKVNTQTEGGNIIVDNNSELEPEVSWILVEPLLTKTYPAPSQELFWLVIGAPVFQLTGNIILPQNYKYSDYALWVKNVIHQMLPIKGPTPYPAFSPSTILLKGSVCEGYSWATAMIANLAGGLPVAIIAGTPPITMPNPGHAISAIVYPSHIENATQIKLVFDIDNDSLNDTAVVLYDTANLNERQLEVMMENLISEIIFPPYRVASGIASGDMLMLSGITNYTSFLGKPFTINIVDKIRDEMTSSIPWIEYVGDEVYKGTVPEVEKLTNPNANGTQEWGNYIWKIRVNVIPGGIPENVTPEWFFYNVILPNIGYGDMNNIQAKGGNKYFTPSLSFIQKVFKLAIEYVWGYPQNYRPLPPPVKPASIPDPPTLEQLYPQLS